MFSFPNMTNKSLLFDTVITCTMPGDGVTWYGIPQNFRHLRIYVAVMSSVAGTIDVLGWRFGTGGVIDSGNNYYGIGKIISETTLSQFAFDPGSYGRGYQGLAGTSAENNGALNVCEILVTRYSWADRFKSFYSIYGNASGTAGSGANRNQWGIGVWKKTDPIDCIQFFNPTAGRPFVAGGYIRIYGM